MANEFRPDAVAIMVVIIVGLSVQCAFAEGPLLQSNVVYNSSIAYRGHDFYRYFSSSSAARINLVTLGGDADLYVSLYEPSPTEQTRGSVRLVRPFGALHCLTSGSGFLLETLQSVRLRDSRSIG
jgi:hypothetical protein